MGCVLIQPALHACCLSLLLLSTSETPCRPPHRLSDYEVGQELLRQYVFIHLAESADKMQLMLAMLHKLYAMVRRGGAGNVGGVQLEDSGIGKRPGRDCVGGAVDPASFGT